MLKRKILIACTISIIVVGIALGLLFGLTHLSKNTTTTTTTTSPEQLTDKKTPTTTTREHSNDDITPGESIDNPTAQEIDTTMKGFLCCKNSVLIFFVSIFNSINKVAGIIR